MEKSVQNKSEGILGAIKSVTHTPVSNGRNTNAEGPLPNIPRLKNLVTRKPSALVQEIALSKMGLGKLGAANAQPPKADNLKTPENEQDSDSRTPSSPPSPVKAQQPDPAPEAEVTTAPMEVQRGIRAPEQKKLSDGETVSVDRKTEQTPTKKVASQTAPVLPEARPAAVNRDVDRILDSLSWSPKGQDYLIEKVRGEISINLLETDRHDICNPDNSIVGPTFSALQYSYHQPQMVKLYGNLISTAMSTKTARFAHPGFVDLIRNITEDEARVLAWFNKNKVLPIIDIKKVITKTQSELRLNTLVSNIAQQAGCEFDDLAEGYLANLERIGLLEIPRTNCLTDDRLYKDVLGMPAVTERLSKLNSGSKGFRGEVVKYYAKLSVFGIKFCHACLR